MKLTFYYGYTITATRTVEAFVGFPSSTSLVAALGHRNTEVSVEENGDENG